MTTPLSVRHSLSLVRHSLFPGQTLTVPTSEVSMVKSSLPTPVRPSLFSSFWGRKRRGLRRGSMCTVLPGMDSSSTGGSMMSSGALMFGCIRGRTRSLGQVGLEVPRGPRDRDGCYSRDGDVSSRVTTGLSLVSRGITLPWESNETTPLLDVGVGNRGRGWGRPDGHETGPQRRTESPCVLRL